jgi:hypothetical protein
MNLKIGIALFAIACVAAAAYTQDTTIIVSPSLNTEEAKQILSMARRDVFQDEMNLTDQEKDAFWNIYAGYEKDRAALIDKQIQLLQEYSTDYSTITDEQAMRMVKQSADLQKKSIDLRAKYADQIGKKVNGKKGARFYQIDDYIATAVRLDVLDNIDFIGKKQ